MSTESAARKAAERIQDLFHGCDVVVETAKIQRIIEAACQTVAPPSGITPGMIWHLIDCVHIGLNGSASAHEGFGHPACIACIVAQKLLNPGAAPAVSTPPQDSPELVQDIEDALDTLETIDGVINLRQQLKAAEQKILELQSGAAVSTPRCPKCGYGGLHLDWNASDGFWVMCGADSRHIWTDLELADFAQFFHPAPSPPPPSNCPKCNAPMEWVSGLGWLHSDGKSNCIECERTSPPGESK